MVNQQSYESVQRIGESILSLDTQGVVILISAICIAFFFSGIAGILLFVMLKLGWNVTTKVGSGIKLLGKLFYNWAQPTYGKVCQAVLEELEDPDAKWDAKTRVLDAGNVQVVMSDDLYSVVKVTTGAENTRDVLFNMDKSDIAALMRMANEVIKRTLKYNVADYERQTLTMMGHRDKAYPDEAKKPQVARGT